MSRSSRAVACDDIEPRSSDGDDTEARARRRRRDDARRDVVMSRCHHRLLPPSLPSRVKAAARIRPIRPASSHTSRAPHGETGLSPHASRPTRNARAEMSSPAAPRMIHQRAVDPPPSPLPSNTRARTSAVERRPAASHSPAFRERQPAPFSRPRDPPAENTRIRNAFACVGKEPTRPPLACVARACRRSSPWRIRALSASLRRGIFLH